MSEKFKELQKRLVQDLSPASYPNFVLQKTINEKNYQVGDYRLKFDPEWSGSTIYLKVRFPINANWNYEKSKGLADVVKKYPRFDLIDMKDHPDAVEIITRRTPITPKMLYDNFIIFDNFEYEKRGIDGMLDNLKNAYKDYIPQWDGVPKSRAEAETWFANRVVTAINEDAIRFPDMMLTDGPDLLEEIGRKYFDARTE
jgi:hypothetical protein